MVYAAIDPGLAQVLPLTSYANLANPVAARAAGPAVPPRPGAAPMPGAALRVVEVGRADGGGLPVRLHVPDPLPPRVVVVVSIHGGGFVLGTAEYDDPENALLASQAGVVVASPEYRLAPEHPFPAAHEDVMTTIEWVRSGACARQLCGEKAEKPRVLGLGVYGHSAGGALAAGAALRLRDESRENPRAQVLDFQVLLEPVLDARLATESMREGTETPVWTRALAEASWEHYLGGREATAYASPALADSLAGLPPTFLTVNEVDPLKDEGINYAVRLKESGVPCKTRVWPGAFHGFTEFRDVPLSRLATAEAVAAVRTFARACESRSPDPRHSGRWKKGPLS